MTPLTTVSGPAAPLMEANVNTDVIVRIETREFAAHDDRAVVLDYLRFPVQPQCWR